MEGLVMAAQMILGLTILVGVHEWGHFFTARKFGMRVEKFYIFIPPKLWSKKIGDTEYGIGSIPLGGFVKISGMIDESMDKDQMNQEPQPWEFRSKPAWQRLIVMLGGIIVNVILGILIFIGVTYYTGENYVPIENVKHGIYAGELAKELGLQNGDQITKVNGREIKVFSEVLGSEVFLEGDAYYTIERNGKEMEIPVPSDFIEKLSEIKNGFSFVTPQQTFKVGKIQPGSNAEKAGLLEGDSIIRMSNVEVRFFAQFTEDKMNFKGKVVPLFVIRDGEQKVLNMEIGKDGVMGFTADAKTLYVHKDLSILESIPLGTSKAFSIVIDNIKGFKKIFSGDIAADKAVQGPIGIAKMFGPTWDWLRFWSICGLLSMVLAFMNLLPIPALDGGHAMLLTYEIISGRKPSDKVVEKLQMIGMVLLLTLMVFVIFNDLIKL